MSEEGDAIGNIPLNLPAEYVERGLTISELVVLSGVKADTIRAIEAGTRPGKPATRAKLRRALDSVPPIRGATPPDVLAQLAELRDLLLLQAESIELLNDRMRDAEAELERLRRANGTAPPDEQSGP